MEFPANQIIGSLPVSTIQIQSSRLFWTSLPLPNPTSNPVFLVFIFFKILPLFHTLYKKVGNFPLPSRDVTNSPWPGIIYLFPARGSLEIANLFLQCTQHSSPTLLQASTAFLKHPASTTSLVTNLLYAHKMKPFFNFIPCRASINTQTSSPLSRLTYLRSLLCLLIPVVPVSGLSTLF